MPSSEYFRRQADICLRLSLVASDEVVSTLLIAMAQDYAAQADVIEAESRRIAKQTTHRTRRGSLNVAG
jgi:hypothetical protein